MGLVKLCFFAAGGGALDLLAGRPSARAGGAEVQLSRLMTCLAGAGHDVTLLHGGAPGVVRARGVSCLGLPVAVRDPRTARRLWTTLERLDPDVVYARLPHDLLVLTGAYARTRRRCRFVYALSSDAFCNPWRTGVHRSWFHAPLYALSMRLADVVVVQHPEQRDLLPAHVLPRSAVVPSLVEVSSAEPRPLDGTRYDGVWISHLRAEKQVEVFLHLVASLPSLRFAMAGADDETVPADHRAALHRRIAVLPNLEHLGLLDHAAVQQLLSSSRALINTSTHEGYPNAMLEAWAAGVPVVALNVDPGRHITREGLGLVSRSESQLAADVLHLARCAADNVLMGRRGQDHVARQHSPAAVLPVLTRVLTSVGGA
jgi:glycosyltransferase involved in cell wall biosynthesis